MDMYSCKIPKMEQNTMFSESYGHTYGSNSQNMPMLYERPASYENGGNAPLEGRDDKSALMPGFYNNFPQLLWKKTDCKKEVCLYCLFNFSFGVTSPPKIADNVHAVTSQR